MQQTNNDEKNDNMILEITQSPESLAYSYRECLKKKDIIINHHKIRHLFSAVQNLSKQPYNKNFDDVHNEQSIIDSTPNITLPDLIQCVACPPGMFAFQISTPHNSNNNTIKQGPTNDNLHINIQEPYILDTGIGICHNNTAHRSLSDQVNDVAHELIHLYDEVRINFDRTNCTHVLCTEIRAAALSGECSLSTQHPKLLNTPSGGGGILELVDHGFQQCVRQHALDNVLTNSRYKDNKADVESLMDKTFPFCFADTSPFKSYPE